jgi:ribosomal protein S18 acetylase RimI-like enzyme
METNIRETKYRFKKDGLKIIFACPKYNLYLPFIAFSILKNRLKNNIVSVYIIQMALEKRSHCEKNNIKKITDVSELKEFCAKREREDKLCEGEYLTEVTDRLKQGDFCVAMLIENNIASVLFVSTNSCYISTLGINLKLPEDTIAIYDVYTSTQYRQKGFYRQIFNYCVNDYFNKGFRQVWLWVMEHNKTSIIVHNALGFKRIIRKLSLKQKFGFRWIKSENIDNDLLALL